MRKAKNANILKYAEQNARKGSFAVGGTFFKISKAAYWIFAIYSILMCMTVMFGNIVLMDEYSAKSTVDMAAAYNEQRTYLITMVLSVLITAACLILLKIRLSIPYTLLGCVNCITAFTVFYGVSVQNDIANGGQGSFWGLFGVPSILCAALAVVLGAVIFLDKRAVAKEYDTIVAKLYSTHKKDGDEKLTPEEFEVVMNEYEGEELFRTDIPLKKSLRRRKEKQEKN